MNDQYVAVILTPKMENALENGIISIISVNIKKSNTVLQQKIY